MEQLSGKNVAGVGLKKLDLSGGESVYCINEGQMARARTLVQSDPERGQVFAQLIDSIENKLSRNERAALAFVLIDRLNRSRE